MRLSFECCVLDSDTREVFRGGNVIALSPKAFLFLEILIRESPRAVSKKSIHQQIWPETFVSDANLPNHVAEVRAALGDDAKKPRIVRTVQRFGYVFRAKTKAAPENPATAGAVYRLIWGNREIDLDVGENLLGRERGAAVWIDYESLFAAAAQPARISAEGGEG